MKKPSLSKQSIGNFFLHHTEKLILALCLALFGLFLWMGLKAEPFDKSSPSDLVRLNDLATDHVNSPKVWDAIKPFRKGRTDVLGAIERSEHNGLKAGAFSIDTLTGIPAKTLDARMDPAIQTPQQPIAFHFRAPLLVASRAESPFSELSPISSPEINRGSGGRNYEADEEYEESFVEADEYGGPTEQGSGRKQGSGRNNEEVEIPTVDAGSQIQTVHVHTMSGLNPKAQDIDADGFNPFLADVICVTAVLDIKKQFQSFDALAGSIGYYPDRDKPVFQHVEIQRRVNGGKWQDRSELVQFTFPSKYPPMHNMPKAFHVFNDWRSPEPIYIKGRSAPDITAPEYYDPVLTGPNPPVAFVNYLPYIGHSSLTKQRMFPDPHVEQYEANGNPWDAGQPDGSGSRQAPEQGSSARDFPGAGDGSGTRGGPGAGGSNGRNLGGGSTGRGLAGQEHAQTRSGADFADYFAALLAERPAEQFKLVRFFDVESALKSKATYEYRMRVWVGDPNNEDLSKEFASYQESGGGSGTRSSGGRDEGGDEDYNEEESPVRRSYVSQGPAVGGAEDEDLGPEWQEITSQMTSISVRRRLKQATASPPDPKTQRINYTVAELRQKKVKGADGKETMTEGFVKIPVPAARPYLRFARPSEWSKSVTLTVEPDNSQVAVGGIVPPKAVRFEVNGVDASFPIGEPGLEIVAATWSQKFGTAVPTKQTVNRGELLNFYTPAHIVDPVTWKVYLTKNSRITQGADQFKVPVLTNKVVVDALGGTELPLPRAEKMRHNVASEILVMDASGNFKISNDMEDRTTYRNLLLQPDESQTVGKIKRPKKKKVPRGIYDTDNESDQF